MYVQIRETPLTDEVLACLIQFSQDWARENSCHGYRPNTLEDIAGNRIFLAEDGKERVGYLFGHIFRNEKRQSIMPEGAVCFEVEELYVIPSHRGQGIGAGLFRHACDALRDEADLVLLSTATKNWKAILHFYLEELGMEFWSARLFKRLR